MPLLCLTFVPQFTLFVGNAIFDEDAFGYLRDNADIAPKIVVSGLLLAVYFSLLGPGDLVAHRPAPVRRRRLPRPDAGLRR